MQLSIRVPQIGGGPAGGAGQVHEDPHNEFGATEHTHSMSPLEIAVMVGIVAVFALVIFGLCYRRARKANKKLSDREGGGRPGTQDGTEMEDKDEAKGPVEVSSWSVTQRLGRRWFGVKDDPNKTRDLERA